jgi:uncharacterized protein (DUF3084 family)
MELETANNALIQRNHYLAAELDDREAEIARKDKELNKKAKKVLELEKKSKLIKSPSKLMLETFEDNDNN